MRGRKTEPTVLKIIRGNPGRRPLNANEAKIEVATPTPPVHLSPEALEEWHRVVQTLADVGLLTEIDRAALAAYCQSYGRWVQAERALARVRERDEATSGLMIRSAKNNAIQNPLVGTANVAMGEMMRFAVEFGMTPSSRARIDVGISAPGSSAQPGDQALPRKTGTSADFYN